ncbi:hypothetical protein QUF70_08085 [Desulfobacterales bacterium HSG17]|nr:hypothetical protein [Desulfobacterales bacterium HSG17]
MTIKSGWDYAHNYDLIVKWMAEALRGETLEVLGIKSGRIEEVFGFEPVEISVKAGRVDVVVKDDTGDVYHIEEQRNLRKADMYRFASYHFQLAKQWPDVKDIILASGKVYKGKKSIKTGSGKYKPIIIDFTKRDARKRLGEIREAINAGIFDNWLELVFLPLYGKETGKERSLMAEEILRYENELYRKDKIPVRLLVAALIISNKMIDKDRLNELWEDIKMLDILELAQEKGEAIGIQKGEAIGIQKGKTLGILEERREIVMDILIERFNLVSSRISERIRSLQNPDILKAMFHNARKCNNLKEFEDLLEQVN